MQPAPITLTVVMYHYVRPLLKTQFPAIKGLDFEAFIRQVRYFKNNYSPITLKDCISAFDGKQQLPSNPVLLTFDDGYTDHFNYVMPILNELSISGAFYPPVNAARDRKVLEVNKIHYILASGVEVNHIIGIINNHIEKCKTEYNLEDTSFYRTTYARATRYDDSNTVYVKKMLQRGLPSKVRSIIIDFLFKKFVTNDEAAFAEQLYLSDTQLKYMVRNGFSIGGHGLNHQWLDSLNDEEQETEIRNSREYLLSLGVDENELTFVYPFGGFNNTTLNLLDSHGFKIAFTTRPGLAGINLAERFLIPRLNTNDFIQ